MRLDKLLEAQSTTTFGEARAWWLRKYRPHVTFKDAVNGPKDAISGTIGYNEINRDVLVDSLEGAPKEVHGDFDCSRLLLRTLEHGPTIVNGKYKCNDNKLTSLKGAPKEVGIFDCSNNQLESLEGLPDYIGGVVNCSNNRLTTFAGAPKIIYSSLIANSNQLTSLKDIHKQIKELHGTLVLDDNPIKSHMLGLLKIKGLQELLFYDAGAEIQIIINKHLRGDRNIFDCQAELEDAGFEEYAKL